MDPSLKVSEEERSQFLTDVLSSGKHLLGLINEILDLAKIEAGKMELQIEPALLQDVVEAVQNTMRSLAVKKSSIFRVESGELPGAISHGRCSNQAGAFESGGKRGQVHTRGGTGLGAGGL